MQIKNVTPHRLLPFITSVSTDYTHTYGCTLQFVLLRMGANSTRKMKSKNIEE
jgi:hypothetical protein